MTIIGLILLCLLGLYMSIGGIIIWTCLSDGEMTPLTYVYLIDVEDMHTLLWGWAPNFKNCISEWWADVSDWMEETLNCAGVIVVSVFLFLAFVGFLIEWLTVMICQIPFVLVCLVVELFARLGKLLFCKK